MAGGLFRSPRPCAGLRPLGWQPGARGDELWHTPQDPGARDTARCHLCLNVTPEPDGFSQKCDVWLPRHGDDVCQTYQTQAIEMNVTEPSPETVCHGPMRGLHLEYASPSYCEHVSCSGLTRDTAHAVGKCLPDERMETGSRLPASGPPG